MATEPDDPQPTREKDEHVSGEGELRELGYRRWTVNHKRILRIMRQESLLCQLKRRFVPTTDSARHRWSRTYDSDTVGR